AYFVLYFFSSTTLLLASILLFLVSISVIDDFEKKVNSHDESFIVIDEVAGVWLAIAISGAAISQLVLSLVLFRVLDIKKPSIIGRIDRNVNGGLGVMGDDMVAGFFAGIISAMIYGIAMKFGVVLP
uniref:phosphatidylglycerophosphatase A family protein n=1 Tax=Campylobacter concisus TaxID=199 RepID=UPI000CD83D65